MGIFRDDPYQRMRSECGYLIAKFKVPEIARGIIMPIIDSVLSEDKKSKRALQSISGSEDLKLFCYLITINSTGTAFKIMYETRTEGSRMQMEVLVQVYISLHKMADKMAEFGYWTKSTEDDFFRNLDPMGTMKTAMAIFASPYARSGISKQNTKREAPYRKISMVLLAVFACALFYAVGASQNKNEPAPTSQPATTRPAETAPATQKPTEGEALKRVETPENGKILVRPSGEMIAPLTIKTSYSDPRDYYFVLTRVGSKKAVMSFFVRGGSNAEINVPLGVYEIYYASGYSWYGKKDLFGSDTIYQKCEGTFEFTDDGESYIGWTLQMQKVDGGNMETYNVKESDFPN